MAKQHILSFIAGASVLLFTAGCGEMENGQQAFDRGTQLLNEGQYDDAIQAFDKAISLDPGHSKAYASRGSALSDQGNYEKALADLTKAIDLAKEANDQAVLSEYYFNRALAYSRMQKYKEGIADFDMAVQMSPNDPDYYNGRSRAYYFAGDTNASIKDAGEALELNQEKDERRARSLFTRGSAYLKAGKVKEAVTDLSEAANLDKKNATIMHELAEAQNKAGNSGEAQADEKKAKTLGYKGQDAYSFR
ncbi:MAG: tetratricopeptide repeat protein [Candidatus Obscuribacterales bacterium]|jgi:tetratricopeptide (TPR) repeat protein